MTSLEGASISSFVIFCGSDSISESSPSLPGVGDSSPSRALASWVGIAGSEMASAFEASPAFGIVVAMDASVAGKGWLPFAFLNADKHSFSAGDVKKRRTEKQIISTPPRMKSAGMVMLRMSRIALRAFPLRLCHNPWLIFSRFLYF